MTQMQYPQGPDSAIFPTQLYAPSGTLMLFQQSSAPVGWTKQTTHNDKALRVVSGAASSGGTTAFSATFAGGLSTGSYTLLTADIPAHSHPVSDPGHSHVLVSGAPTVRFLLPFVGGGGNYGAGPATTADAISDQSATTGITTSNTGGGGGHSHTLSLGVQFVDLIIAQKD